jgi:dTDP-4-amino-4,6-dideoxygalactose transaminase
MMRVPFNKPHVTGRELEYIQQAVQNHHLSGNGPFTRQCQAWIEDRVGCPRALLTHSCTAALEMAALLTEVGPGDEVIMPSFTFVSTANAFALRGARPVFVDVRPDTLNLDESKVEAAITDRTRAIVPVHYAGVACEMDTLCAVAARHTLFIVEDAAQGVMATYKGRPLGSIGHAAALSFHETKNVTAGEGGALIVNAPEWTERAEVLWEKGTNRTQFARGEVDKYSWIDLGSSYLPSEISAAFLWAQFEHATAITEKRLALWRRYHEVLAPFEEDGLLRRPIVPDDCAHNAHMYYVLVAEPSQRARLLSTLDEHGINAVSHYVPLHTAPAGRRFGRVSGSLEVTERVAAQLVRLPLWFDMTEGNISAVIDAIAAWAASTPARRQKTS